MRGEVIKLLQPLDPVPVENALVTGTTLGQPDVDFANGAAELKWLRDWPVRPTTIVRLDHYTDNQRAWLLRRWRAGEMTFLVLQAARVEWLIWRAPEAQQVGTLTRQGLYDTAYRRWTRKPTSEELVEAFRRGGL